MTVDSLARTAPQLLPTIGSLARTPELKGVLIVSARPNDQGGYHLYRRLIGEHR